MSLWMFRLFTAVAVLGAAGFGWWLSRLQKALSKCTDGYLAPQLRFRYTAKQLQDGRDALGQDGMAILKRFSLLVLPMLLFAGMCMAVVAQNAAVVPWAKTGMNHLAVLACVLGAAETLMLRAYRALRAAAFCSLCKWVAAGIWVAGMFMCLFITSTAL